MFVECTLLLALNVSFVFFFFQAEDGIRDHCVTGVQTCALPISPRESCCGLWERREPRPSPARRSAARRRCSPLGTASANIMASITFSSALRAESRLNVWNTYPRRSALNRSRRASGRAEISIPSTWMVPAVGTETPAIRLRSVVLPEPLRPRRTVQDPAGRLRPSMSRTSSVFPTPSGNDFFTLRITTAGTMLSDGDRVDRHADPAAQQQWT